MKAITVIAAGLAVALSLAGCAKPTATGSYSKTNPNVALLIDLVEAEHGNLSGRMELVTLMADGSVQDRTAAVEGQADGEHLSLTIKPGEFLAQPETISAERNGDELHISGKGLDGSVKRQPLRTFEDGVKAIRAKSAEMIAANARTAAAAKLAADRAQADAERSRLIYQLKFDTQNLKGQIDLLLGRVDRLKPKSEELIAAFSRQTEKVEGLLRQERSFADVAERGQVRFAISQAVMDTERQIGEVTSGAQGLSNAIRDANEEAKQISIRCAAPQFASDASVASSCKAVSDDVSRLQTAAQQASPTLRELEATYRSELEKQKRLEAEADRLTN
ncbi:MAG: hypothetical protein ABSC25_13355 [Roseiarcus sp.]|jgi:hypothetical protein